MANYDGPESHPSDHRTLLVIDGTAGEADTYQHLLQQHREPSYRVLVESYDGPVLARCQSQPIDGILLTCPGPDTPGLELLRHLNAQLGHGCPPTIAIGDNDATLAVQALRAGAIDYLVRDRLTADQLHQALEAALPTAGGPAHPAARQLDRERFLAVGSDLQAIAGPDGYFHWVSPNFERVLGWTTAEMTSRPWLEFVHPDDRSASVLESERLLSGREILAFENRYRHSDGTYRWLRWRCQMDVAQQVSYGTAIDITAFKESEAALDNSFDELVEQSHSFDAMLSTISDFVYLFDRQGRYVFVNQPLLDLWGLTLADAVGKNFFDLNYPSDLAAKLQQQIEQVFVTAQPVRDDMPYTSPTGVSGVYEYIFAPLLGPEGVVQAVVGSTRDVTERKLIEATLQASEERLRLIADTVPQIIWITDADGRVEFVNQQWRDYTGALEEPTTALDAMVSFVHPEDVTATMAAFNQALQAGGAFRAEHRIQAAAGTYRWFLIQAEPYRDPQTGRITRWFGTLVDVHDLKIAEAALRVSEEKYRSLFSSMDEGFCILQVIFDDSDRPIDYRYVECNPVFERQTGLSNVLGKTIRELVPNIEPFWFDIYGRVALTGDPMRFEDHAKSMGRWFDVNAFRIGEPHERKVAVLFNDITERKRREANAAFLAEVAEYLSRLESADDIMQVIGAKIGAYLQITACLFGEVNESQNEIVVNYGWRDAQVPSLLRTYRLREYLTEEFSRASRAGETVVVCNTQIDGRADGPSYAELKIQAFVTVPFHHNGQWLYYLAIIDSRPRTWRDDELNLIKELSNRIFPCLERAYAEERLRQSEERFRLLVTTSSDTLYSMSADWSEMRNLDGKNFLLPTDQPDRNWLERYIPLEDQPQVLAVIRQAIRDRGPFEFEHRVMRLDGTVGWTSSRAVPLLNEHNEIVEWFGAASDVTERKQLLKRERTARENAERANRTKDEFLAILSHELRSPLNPILGWAKLLQMRTFDAEKTQQALATIERNAQLQTQLIDDLLDVAKILRGKLELNNASIDLATVIEAAMEVVRTSVQAKSIVVQMSLAEGCLVTGDDARLQQVIWNLLSNAVKFTPQGGQIEICLEPMNDCAQVTITDNGKGISAEFLPQLFDSFRQEDVSITRQYGGLGLGLSIVKYLVEAHGGSIAATSPGPGQGATFTLRLPLVQPTAIPPLTASVPPANIDLSGVKVLTVDDSEDTRDLVAALLERYGAEVRVATSGQEVLSQLASFEPDVLVCDICMPAMDGYTLLQEIRRLPPEQGGELPAIAVTAYARDDDQQQALNHGFQHHIPKPIEPETLLGAVAGLTKHRHRGRRNNSPDTFHSRFAQF